MECELNGKRDSHHFDDKLMYFGPTMELPGIIRSPGFTSIQEGEFISIMNLLSTYLLNERMSVKKSSDGKTSDERIKFAKTFMLLTPENRQKVLTQVCKSFYVCLNKKEVIEKTGLLNNLTPLQEMDMRRFERGSIFQIMLNSFMTKDFPLKEILKEDPSYLKSIKYPELKKLIPQSGNKQEMESFLYKCGLRDGFYEMVDFLFMNDSGAREKIKKEYMDLKNPIIESLFTNLSEVGKHLSNIEISDLYNEWESEDKYEKLLKVFNEGFENEVWLSKSSALTGIMNILVSEGRDNELYKKLGKGFFSKSYYKKIENEEEGIVNFEINPVKILKTASFSQNRDHIIDYFKAVEGQGMLWSDEVTKMTWNINDMTAHLREIEQKIKEIEGDSGNITYHDRISLENLKKNLVKKDKEINEEFLKAGRYLFPLGTEELLLNLSKDGMYIELSPGIRETEQNEKYPIFQLSVPKDMESVIEGFLENAFFLDKGQLSESFASTITDYAMRKYLSDNAKIAKPNGFNKRKF